MDRCLSVFFWPLSCLSFFYLRILISLLIYLNSSYCGMASTSGRLNTEVWHYLHLWYLFIFEKGYPMGYRPFFPLFVPGILHTAKEKKCTGLCGNDLWVIHERFLISLWFDIQNDGQGAKEFPVGWNWRKWNSSDRRGNAKIVMFMFLLWTNRRRSLSMSFILHRHSWKTGKTVKC